MDAKENHTGLSREAKIKGCMTGGAAKRSAIEIHTSRSLNRSAQY